MIEKFQGEKRKQYIILGSVVAISTLGIIMISKILSPGESQSGQEKEKKAEVKVVDEKRVEEEPFKKVYGDQLAQLQKELEELKRQQDRQITLQEPPPPLPPTLQGPPPEPPPQEQIKVVEKTLDNLIVLQKTQTPTEAEAQAQTQEQQKQQKKRKNVKDIIPAASFVKGVLLSGLDAPTSGNATSNPHPVLIKIKDLAILPNKYKLNIKDCFIIGSGYGDLSSERAYIRLEKLSCIRENGDVLSQSVDGYVAGEDGKVGLKGRVVSKQGQIIARALISGFVEGTAKAFSYSTNTIATSPLGSTTTIDPNKVVQAGIGEGVNEAAKKLADFYMNLVNKTFPIVEIQAGRDVDIVFLKDVDLEDK